MAGSFGFEREHYDVSLAVGELELLPAIRQAPKGELLITNGFSCLEQIAQTTDRQGLHLAQVIQMAMHEGPGARQAIIRKGIIPKSSSRPSRYERSP